MDIYQIIMTLGAILLIIAQMLGRDEEWSYEIFMIVGLLTILIPPLVLAIEIIRYHV